MENIPFPKLIRLYQLKEIKSQPAWKVISNLSQQRDPSPFLHAALNSQKSVDARPRNIPLHLFRRELARTHLPSSPRPSFPPFLAARPHPHRLFTDQLRSSPISPPHAYDSIPFAIYAALAHWESSLPLFVYPSCPLH